MVKITADSTCDLSAEIVENYDITITPLTIMVGDKAYIDGVDITPDDIFRYVDEEGKTCKTAAINAFDYEQVFGKYSAEYEGVVHINISSDFSSCHQNALQAAQSFDNVYVIDSKNLSTGSGHLVYAAALMAKEGHSAEEICAAVEKMIPFVDASFVIDTLDYLYKGGRCSGLELLGAKVLKIKPSIEVVKGSMKVGKKYRGGLEQCILRYLNDKMSDIGSIDKKRIFLTHCRCPQEIVEKVESSLKKDFGFDDVIITEAGCTISSHCGPGTLGVLYIRNNEKTSIQV
ncbi:MAG: DegV family protein [Ruminococcaceae bacterium]|nr:DegV family protein [Oscillospiraceae bacterium]